MLSTFDALVYHLFEFEYQGLRIGLPSDEDEFYVHDARTFRLSRLDMNIGDTLEMTCDFGMDQGFHFELLAIDPMPAEQRMRYPKIIDGAGRGILDDYPADETAALVEQIDRNGHTDEPVFYGEDEQPWDYRKYDLDANNARVRSEITYIRDRYLYPYDAEE